MKKFLCSFAIILFVASFQSPGYGASGKLRIFVVSSYHREYLWSQDTQKGLCAAFKDFKFLENDSQAEEFTENDFVETNAVVIKKAWMDTKRWDKKNEIAAITIEILREMKAFNPDLILLGDDNATNFIGAYWVNTRVPVVFWGVDFDPLAYGYIDTMAHPGHNVTGVYQSGETYAESLRTLKKLFPDLKTFAILSDGSETGRAKSRMITRLAEEGRLPLRLVDTVETRSFSEWRDKALELQEKVDAFFVVNHASLKNDQGVPVDSLEVGAWYLAHIKKPEAGPEKQFVQEGMLLSVDDSGYKQGYEAGRMADRILHQRESPAGMAVIAPTRGTIMVNRQRAAALGVDVSNKDFIEEFVESSASGGKYPR